MIRSIKTYSVLLLTLCSAQPHINTGKEASTVTLGIGAALCFTAGMIAQPLVKKLIAFKNWTTPVTVEKTRIGFLTIDLKKSIWDYMASFEELFTNKSIQAIIVIVEGSSVNEYGIATALLQTIRELRQLYPKPVIAYSEKAMEGAYYVVACAADTIYTSAIAKSGGIGVLWSSQRTHEKDKEDGIDYYYSFKGDYKPAGMVRIPLSQPHRAMLQQVVTDLHEEVTKDIIEARPSIKDTLQLWQDGKIFSTQEAHLQAHLTDGIANKFELIGAICKRIHKPFDPATIEPVVKQVVPLSLTPAQHPIPPHKIGIGIYKINNLEKLSSGWDYMPDLLELFTRADIKGIILAINSVGGFLWIAHSFHEDLQLCKKYYKKPVIAYIESKALSSAYTIASACDYIIAAPAAEVGSVGIFLERLDQSKKDLKEHILYETVKSNEYSDTFDIHTSLNEQKKRLLDHLVTEEYNSIIEKIKKARPCLTTLDDSQWKEAQRFAAPQALKLGLIDSIGSPLDALAYIKQQLKHTSLYKKSLEDICFIVKDISTPSPKAQQKK